MTAAELESSPDEHAAEEFAKPKDDELDNSTDILMYAGSSDEDSIVDTSMAHTNAGAFELGKPHLALLLSNIPINQLKPKYRFRSRDEYRTHEQRRGTLG